MFDFSFNNSRRFAVADAHGSLPIEILIQVLPYFNHWIIQMDSEDEFSENLEQIIQISKHIELNHCFFIIRNAKFPKDKQQIPKQFENDINLKKVSILKMRDLTEKQLDQQTVNQEIQKFSSFIFGNIKNEYLQSSKINIQSKSIIIQKIIEENSNASQRGSKISQQNSQIVQINSKINQSNIKIVQNNSKIKSQIQEQQGSLIQEQQQETSKVVQQQSQIKQSSSISIQPEPKQESSIINQINQKVPLQLKTKFQNRNTFLVIILQYENFTNDPEKASYYFIKENSILQNMDTELNLFSKSKLGFYEQTAFPIRSLNWQISEQKKIQVQNDDLSKDDKRTRYCEIEKKIKQLQDQIKSAELTVILDLFQQILLSKNSYILFLKFSDQIRVLNENFIYKLQDQNQELNEKLQKTKLEKKQKQELNGKQSESVLKMDKEIEKQKHLLKENLEKIEFLSVGVELFWRDIISIKQKGNSQMLNIDPVQEILKMIDKGEPFEFLNGDELKIDQEFLKQVIKEIPDSKSGKVLILSVVGPQSSGKSTILNKIFGCHFWTSVGRCTKGIYLQLLKVHQKQLFKNIFDYILILDTEGLQNPNQIDQEFDKKIALFILAVSDIILINVKGDIHSQFKSLIQVCVFSLGQLRSQYSSIKQLNWCFNQNNDCQNYAPFLNQIQGLVNNLNSEMSYNDNQNIDYNEILEIKKQNIKILGFATDEKGWRANSDTEVFQDWRQYSQNETFSGEAYIFGIQMISQFIEKFSKPQQDEKQMKILTQFVEKFIKQQQDEEQLSLTQFFERLCQQQQDEKQMMILTQFVEQFSKQQQNGKQILSLKQFTEIYCKQQQDEKQMLSLGQFIENIENQWESICRLPDLLEFTELIQYQQDDSMKNYLEETIFKIYKLDYQNQIPKRIVYELNQQMKKSLELCRKIKLEQEKIIKEVVEDQQQLAKDDLQKFKTEKQIQKKIYQKYLNIIEKRFQGYLQQCNLTLLNIIQKHEREFQQSKGFSQLENFVEQISNNAEQLQLLKADLQGIENKFTEIWDQILDGMEIQQSRAFEEFAVAQFQTIYNSFTKYNYQTGLHQKHQDFLISQISKKITF